MVQAGAALPVAPAPTALVEKALILPAGTPVRFTTTVAIDSRSVRQGQRFDLVLAEDVSVGSTVVLPKGTAAVGEVDSLSEKGMFGKGAKLALRPLFIDHGNRRIPLTGLQQAEGREAVGASAVTTVLFGAFGLIITGKSATVPAGSALFGAVRNDVSFSAGQ